MKFQKGRISQIKKPNRWSLYRNKQMNILCQIFEQEDPKNTIHPKMSNDQSMAQLNQTTENKSMVPGVDEDWFIITGQKIEDPEGI